MKILIFNWRDIKNPLAGGAEVLTHQLAKKWSQQGHQVVLFSSFFKGALKEEDVDNVRIIRAGNRLTVYWQAYRYYSRVFKGHFDIIIDEINTIPFFTIFYSKEPVVCHINQLAKEVWFYESFFPLALLGYLLEPVFLLCYRKKPVITISQSTKDDLLRLGFEKEKMFIIPMGIDFNPLEAAAEKEASPTIIYVGRLKKSKRVHHIIQAFRVLKKEIPECKLWIVGSGDLKYEKKLYRLARGLEGVKFFHQADDKEKLDLMKRAHVLAAASIREGWGLVVTEANAMGTPAVGYRVPGLKDSIKDAVNGFLCKKNTPEELSALIAKLLKNKESYFAMAKNALELSKEYTWLNTSIKGMLAINEILNLGLNNKNRRV